MSIHQFALSKVSCASCVRSIERALDAEERISDYAINFAERSASIQSEADPAAIIQVIENAGYGASLIDNEEDLEAREEQQRTELKQQFEQVANQLFEVKTAKFDQQNRQSLDAILSPLKVQNEGFKKQVSDSYTNEAKERHTLSYEIKSLQKLNQEMAKEAIKKFKLQE